jgi:hypothetical protein
MANEGYAVRLGKFYRSRKKESLMMNALELREKGYQILVNHLGQSDAIRFLQQMGWEGDYTQERHEVLGSVTREEFLQELRKVRNL